MAEQHGKTLVPQIRFAGFTDPWEQRKLGELFEESDERASDREILSVSVANGIYPASESDRETNPGASLANYKVVHSGDVVYNSMRMWQGAVDASRYDGIVSPAYVVAKPNSEVYARFFARLLRQPMLLKQYQQVSQGNSKDTQVLKFDDFASIEISMPASENEQRQIGAFFDRLDSLITLHQRKYDKLCVLKKSMLDKMFPKGGSLYPEIRFAGFTDPWEQRKLSDLTDRVSIQSSDSDLPQVEYEDIIPGEGTLNKDLRDKKGGKTGIKFYAGDVLYGKLRPYLMNWLYPQFNGVAVGDFWVLRATECDSSFLYRLVQTGSFQRLANVSSGSKMPRADWNLISQSFFAVPADHAEQKAIAKGLAELDTLITLHQRKYCGVASWMLGVALVRLGSESDGAFGEMKHVLR